MIRVRRKTRWQTPPDPHPHGNADTYWLMDVSMDTRHRGDRHHVSLSAVPSESKWASKAAGREVWGDGHEQRRAEEKLRLSDSQCCSVSLEVSSLMRTCRLVAPFCRWTYSSLSVLFSIYRLSHSTLSPALLGLHFRGVATAGLIYHPIENQLNYSFSFSLYIFPNWLLAIQVSTVSAA